MTCAALLALALLAAAQGADPETQAQALWSQYLDLRGEEGWRAHERRLDLLRGLGRLDAARAREALLKIARSGRTADERVVAILALGRIADLETARALAAGVDKPALCEALGESLGQTARPEVIAWLQGDALKAQRPEVLRACLDALTAMRVASPAVAALAASRDVDVACAAVRALGMGGGAGDRALLLAGAGHADARVRLAAAEVLPRQDPMDERTLEALRALLTDPSHHVRRTAAFAAGAAKLEPLGPDLIGLVEQDPRLAVRQAAAGALKAISGHDLGLDAGGWRTWWRTRSDTDAFGQPKERMTFAKYYGAEVKSDRVLFIVDVSGSMSWPWRKEPKRIDVARSELRRVVKELQPKSLFNVILFSTRILSWQKTEVEASPENVGQAVRWIEKHVCEPEGDTHTYDALERAFAHNPEFDTIYLLSDGNPSHGTFVSPEGIVASVRLWNRHRRATIHTIGLTLENLDRGMPNLAEDLEQMKDFLQRLASATGGECRIVTYPPK